MIRTFGFEPAPPSGRTRRGEGSRRLLGNAVAAQRLRRLLRALGLAVLGLTAFAPGGRADLATLTPSRDNTLYEDPAGNLSNGAGLHFFAGNNAGAQTRRGLAAFDVAGAVPAGSTINAVTLTLNMSRTQAVTQTVSLHRVTADWGEGSSAASGNEGGGALSTTGDATWIHTFFDTAFWTTPGGDFDPTPSASVAVGNIGFYSWSSAAMVADVQSWLDDPIGNFGWIAIGGEVGAVTSKRFDSRQNTVPDNRPQLVIDFTPPGATGACCSVDGSCAEADGATCSGSYEGDGTTCTPNPCPPPTGACCFADPAATCVEDVATGCTAAGGSFQGALSVCTPNPCPVVLTPFVDPLPIPAVAQPETGQPGATATYAIAARQVQQQLHRDLPPTTIWGYGDGESGASFPGPTIEAFVDHPVTVRWINDLRDGAGELRTDHILPVDNCLHGAMENEARTVVHLHGTHAPAEFDGYPEDTFLPGEDDVYVYPNGQLPSTLWYHDHSLGITRLNVYMGLAAFYLIRDGFEQGLGLPHAEFEVPLAIVDRTFNPDGSLSYPADWQELFFGEQIVVNGKVWPYLEVKQGKYRFRVLNASNSRTLTLGLSNGDPFYQIGSDGGLLPAPALVSQLTLGPAERADIVVDFASYAPGTEITLVNSAPAPYPGLPGVGVVPDVMQFVVKNESGFNGPLPASLRPIEPLQEADAVEFRDFTLGKQPDACSGSIWTINGLRWDDITEYPELGTTEVWRFINPTGMMHPMHMHLVMFQVLDRQGFTMVDGEAVPSGPLLPLSPGEEGWKDTVQVGPNEMVRVIARFEDFTGKFAYHCHIVEHEDQEMMRQFQAVSCGNAAVEPTEECDDGNTMSADGCASTCEIEDLLTLAGVAEGGTVELEIDGVQLIVVTFAGQSASDIAAAVAAAVLADTTLSEAGVTAVSNGNTIATTGTITNLVITDPGISSTAIPTFPSGYLVWLLLAFALATTAAIRLRAPARC